VLVCIAGSLRFDCGGDESSTWTARILATVSRLTFCLVAGSAGVRHVDGPLQLPLFHQLRDDRARYAALRRRFWIRLAWFAQLELFVLPARARLALKAGNFDARCRSISIALHRMANGVVANRVTNRCIENRHAMGDFCHRAICSRRLDFTSTHGNAWHDAGMMLKPATQPFNLK
jgi:hypothetical protein